MHFLNPTRESRRLGMSHRQTFYIITSHVLMGMNSLNLSYSSHEIWLKSSIFACGVLRDQVGIKNCHYSAKKLSRFEIVFWI